MKSQSKKIINVGLLGLGTVGTGVAKILLKEARVIEQKTGLRLVLKRVGVRSVSKKRSVRLPRRIFSKPSTALIQDPSIDIVVELIGGIHPAKEIIQKSLSLGKGVVTANKALLAEHGDAIFKHAQRYGRGLGFEASVCGGIPLIKVIREGLAADHVSKIFGIVNGTSNYILTAMSQRPLDFSKALGEAQRQGYAEADPRFDIEGIDSAHKLAILARLAFGAAVPFKTIFTEGIRSVSLTDMEYAKELGYTVKLLAIGKRTA